MSRFLTEYAQVMIPVIGLALNVLIQVVSVRYVEKLTLLKSVFTGFFGGMAGVLSLELLTLMTGAFSMQDSFAFVVANLLIYAAFGYCYFHFINLGETARRIRIVRELYDAPDGLTLSEILERYNAQQIIAMRMGRLLHNGQIIETDGKYIIGNPTMLLIAKSITTMKWLVLGKRSEFE